MNRYSPCIPTSKCGLLANVVGWCLSEAEWKMLWVYFKHTPQNTAGTYHPASQQHLHFSTCMYNLDYKVSPPDISIPSGSKPAHLLFNNLVFPCHALPLSGE